VAAVLRAAKAAGLEVAKVEVDPITGKIVIMTLAGSAKEQVGDLDKWLARHGAC
jgi:hypothetical protein